MGKVQMQDKGEGPSTRKSRKKTDKKPYDAGGDGSDLPGVQKLKSALRQTRRLLSKDTLAADLRLETERRLKSLEADLALAEIKKKERAFATKYHAIKFFERQKVTRKIKQVKGQIEVGLLPESIVDLQESLNELRVDLNYILHYPKLERYISLFPPSVRHRRTAEHEDEENEDDDEGGSPRLPPNETTDAKRQAIRNDIRSLMKSGELSNEPEMDVQKAKAIVKEGQKRRTAIPFEKDTTSRNGKGHKMKGVTSKKTSIPVVASVGEDDFFDVGDE